MLGAAYFTSYRKKPFLVYCTWSLEDLRFVKSVTVRNILVHLIVAPKIFDRSTHTQHMPIERWKWFRPSRLPWVVSFDKPLLILLLLIMIKLIFRYQILYRQRSPLSVRLLEKWVLWILPSLQFLHNLLSKSLILLRRC